MVNRRTLGWKRGDLRSGSGLVLPGYANLSVFLPLIICKIKSLDYMISKGLSNSRIQ